MAPPPGAGGGLPLCRLAAGAEARLLSALSSQIVDAIFGENPQESGVISFGGQTIEFFRSLDSVTLIIRDDTTGEETRIVVPLFLEVN